MRLPPHQRHKGLADSRLILRQTLPATTLLLLKHCPVFDLVVILALALDPNRLRLPELFSAGDLCCRRIIAFREKKPVMIEVTRGHSSICQASVHHAPRCTPYGAFPEFSESCSASHGDFLYYVTKAFTATLSCNADTSPLRQRVYQH